MLTDSSSKNYNSLQLREKELFQKSDRLTGHFFYWLKKISNGTREKPRDDYRFLKIYSIIKGLSLICNDQYILSDFEKYENLLAYTVHIKNSTEKHDRVRKSGKVCLR